MLGYSRKEILIFKFSNCKDLFPNITTFLISKQKKLPAQEALNYIHQILVLIIFHPHNLAGN